MMSTLKPIIITKAKAIIGLLLEDLQLVYVKKLNLHMSIRMF